MIRLVLGCVADEKSWKMATHETLNSFMRYKECRVLIFERHQPVI